MRPSGGDITNYVALLSTALQHRWQRHSSASSPSLHVLEVTTVVQENMRSTTPCQKVTLRKLQVKITNMATARKFRNVC